MTDDRVVDELQDMRRDLGRTFDLIRSLPAPVVNLPPQPAPAVTVEVPKQAAPVVNVEVKEQPAPQVTVEPAVVNVAAPAVTVEPLIRVEAPGPSAYEVEITGRDPNGFIRTFTIRPIP